MNIQMMEGLMGASSNIRLSGTSMSVYRQASAEGDTEKMQRALGYTGECTRAYCKKGTGPGPDPLFRPERAYRLFS